MKKAIKVMLAASMAAMMTFAMTACGGSNNGSGSSNPPAADTQQQQAPADVAPADTTPAEPTSSGPKKVGVSMPTQSLQRWNQDGSNMKQQLEAAGFTVDLQYGGDNDIATQVNQIENMISGGCDLLVIAPIDGNTLTSVLAEAKSKGIPVISYDRLIMDSDAVTYYATFDNEKVGVVQGSFIETALDLKNAAGPFNIELFTGDPADNNVNYFFGGAMGVLQPYIDSGKLVVKSGQTTKDQCATDSWNTEKSQARMENLIAAQSYGPNGTKLDAVLSSNDSVANGITNALVNAGYTAENFPVLTGQDCDITSVKNMLKGEQSMSVFKDTRTLAAQVVKMAQAVLEGGTPEINDTSNYDNGTGIIPSFLCDPVIGTVDNYKTLLIDSGYYKESELQ